MTAPGEAEHCSWRRNGAWAAAAGLPVGTGQVEASKGLAAVANPCMHARSPSPGLPAALTHGAEASDGDLLACSNGGSSEESEAGLALNRRASQ